MPYTTKEVATVFLPLLRVFTDGTVERLVGSPYVPPSLTDSITHVSSKDISISANVSARLYLPGLLAADSLEKLPILVYFHGGEFCVESAFSELTHRYMNILAEKARILVASVEFRLAPEHPLPVAYEDSWVALQWICSHSVAGENTNKEPWLVNHGDFSRVYVGGDTTGANITHNIVMRAGAGPLNGEAKILEAFLSQPFFWGSKPIRAEPSSGHQENMICRVWKFVYPSAPDGIDNPMINPFSQTAPSLARLGCSKLLVCVGDKDVPKERGIHYCDVVKESGWKGEVEFYEVVGGKHGFHILDPETDLAKEMFSRLASFLK